MFVPRVLALSRDITISDGNPNRLIEIDNALALPGVPTIWDADGQRIDESCIRRGPQLSFYARAGTQTVEVPPDCVLIDEPQVYLSFLPNAWGHFLLESLSRTWALREIPELEKVPYFFGFVDPNAERFLGLFDHCSIDLARRRQWTTPVRIRKCLVPIPSFSIRAEAWTGHANTPRAASERVLGTRTPRRSAQPVYLSRSGLNYGRIIRNETELEGRLAARGVLVVHPQRLPLEEQIRLFNTHDTFIGCWGSAFHNLIFQITPRGTTTHVLCEDIPNMNYLMVDAILGLRANYVQALVSTQSEPQALPTLESTLDVECVVDYLASRGMFA